MGVDKCAMTIKAKSHVFIMAVGRLCEKDAERSNRSGLYMSPKAVGQLNALYVVTSMGVFIKGISNPYSRGGE